MSLEPRTGVADTSATMDEPSASALSFWERLRAARAAATGIRIHPLASWAGWGFVLFAAIAVGYGLWALYGSGTRVTSLDLAEAPARPGGSASTPPPVAAWSDQPGTVLGPVVLDPGMNPLRAVLHAAYAPMGSTRIRFEIEIADDRAGRALQKQGTLGSRDDDASIVRTTGSLGDFRVGEPGHYFVRARFADDGMDDLRAATLELRRNVVPVDARIPWGFGIAAVLCLVMSHVVTHRGRWPYRSDEIERKTAA